MRGVEPPLRGAAHKLNCGPWGRPPEAARYREIKHLRDTFSQRSAAQLVIPHILTAIVCRHGIAQAVVFQAADPASNYGYDVPPRHGHHGFAQESRKGGVYWSQLCVRDASGGPSYGLLDFCM